MRIKRHFRLPTRRGFTIVELLVAAAVSIVLMVILTEAFKRGIDMFRTLRAQGQLQERLRFASITMRDDLASFHFDVTRAGATSQQNYLRDVDLRADDQIPRLGFFRIIQASVTNNPVDNLGGEPCIFEGTDGDGMLFTRATTHALHFAVLRRETSPAVMAKNPVDPSYLFRTSESPPRLVNTPQGQKVWPNDYIDPPDFREAGMFSSRWAEVAYFLAPGGNSANGLPLFKLYRRIKYLVPDEDVTGNTGIPAGNIPANPLNIEISTRTQVAPSATGAGVFYNRPGMNDSPFTGPGITQPRNRFSMMPCKDDTNDPNIAGVFQNAANYTRLQDDLGLGAAQAGDDILLSDVVSFEVKATWDVVTDILNPYYGLVTPPRLSYSIPALNPNQGNTPPYYPYPNTDYPYDYIPLSPVNKVFSTPGVSPLVSVPLRVFDTWSGNPNEASRNIYAQPRPSTGPMDPGGTGPAWSDMTPTPQQYQTGARIPLRIRVKALLIKIRIWDAKAEQTRQMTFIVDM